MPEIDPLQLILAELREVKETANEAYGISKELKQTLHGPPGSDNGMYRDLKWVKEQLKIEVLPFIERQKTARKIGMTRLEKFWFILLASVVSGVVGVIVSLINFGGA